MKTLACARAAVAVAALAACATNDAAPRRDSAAAAPAVVSLTATDYAIQVPETIPAGWVTLRMANEGREVHYGHIVQLAAGRTAQHLVDAYAEAIRTSGPRPKWVSRFGGPGGAAPGGSSSVTQYLEPGDYVWICPVEDSEGHPHFGKGEYEPFVVHSAGAMPARSGAAPDADAVVRLMDYDFTLGTPLRRGRQTIRVENVGVEPHDLVLMRLAPGMTADDVRVAMNPERARRADAAKPVPSMESVGTLAGGIAAIGTGREVFFDAELTAGEYVMICMATAADGQSHIEHGMIRQVSVR